MTITTVDLAVFVALAERLTEELAATAAIVGVDVPPPRSWAEWKEEQVLARTDPA